MQKSIKPNLISTNRITRFLLFSFFACALTLGTNKSYSQDSCNLRISLLTCSPGEELYSTFGHSALRVTDPTKGMDVVFNYGTFNFDEPGFYTKFIRGKLLYYLSTEDFFSFSEDYRRQQRSMIEQVLNLNCTKKEKLVSLLQENLLPQNRNYKYDFLFDNCTTRLRDLVEKVAASGLTYPAIVDNKTSFRDVIHLYLDDNNQHWSKLGIDLLLGSRTDKIMTNREAMFLPDYLMHGFDSTRSADKNLVEGKSILFKSELEQEGSSFLTHPLFITSMLLLIVVLLSFSKKDNIIFIMKNFDSMFFFLIGALGLLMTFMWLGTDHLMCKDNYNLLWALPTHAVFAFFINSKKSWVKTYLLITALIYLIVLIAWFFLPQELNPAIVPIILLLMFRALVNRKARK